MKSLVGLQSVSSVPVASAFYQSTSSLDSRFGEEFISKEETNPYNSKDDIDLCAQDASLFKQRLECRNRLVL
jgi:hypothetical protein